MFRQQLTLLEILFINQTQIVYQPQQLQIKLLSLIKVDQDFFNSSLIKIMRLHTNPKTGDAMTANMNTSQMPRFLQPSHGKMFEFADQSRTASRKRYLVPSRSTTVQDLISPVLSNSSQISVAYSPVRDHPTQSFGHSSYTMKVLMKDTIPASSVMSKSYVHNRILNISKEMMVPVQESGRLRTFESWMGDSNSRQSFFKPGEMAKLTSSLNRSKVLMRQKQPESPRTISRFSDLYRSKGVSELRKSTIKKKEPQINQDLLRTQKVKSTIYDYQRLYQRQADLDPQSLQNTMNHILAFNHILKQVSVNPHKKQKRRYYGKERS